MKTSARSTLRGTVSFGRRGIGAQALRRALLLLFSCCTLGPLAACGGSTGIDLLIRVDPSLGIDRLMISVAGEDDSPIGEPHHRPQTARLLDEEESVVILLDDDLAGSRVTLHVVGESEGTVVVEASAEVSIRAKILVSVTVELGDQPADCVSDDQCEELLCEEGSCVPGCRIDSTFVLPGDAKPGDPCSFCAPEDTLYQWTLAEAGTECGTDLVCDEDGECVPTHEDEASLTVTIDGNGSGWVTDSDDIMSCSTADEAPCSAAFPLGSIVTLTAAADPDSYFTGWQGGGCSGTDSLCDVTMTSDREVTASFTRYCVTPWETKLEVGESVLAYRSESEQCCPSDEGCCEPQERTCDNESHLSGQAEFSKPQCEFDIAVGAPCDDGSLYAGVLQDNHYYVAPEDLRTITGCADDREFCADTEMDCHPNEFRWDCPPSGQAYAATGATSTNDGWANTESLTGLRYRAAARCSAFDFNGRGDYFLPAVEELQHLYSHRGAIDNLAVEDCGDLYRGSNVTCAYWSSTETGATKAASIRFDTGEQSDESEKWHTHFVRCVRKHPVLQEE